METLVDVKSGNEVRHQVQQPHITALHREWVDRIHTGHIKISRTTRSYLSQEQANEAAHDGSQASRATSPDRDWSDPPVQEQAHQMVECDDQSEAEHLSPVLAARAKLAANKAKLSPMEQRAFAFAKSQVGRACR